MISIRNKAPGPLQGGWASGGGRGMDVPHLTPKAPPFNLLPHPLCGVRSLTVWWRYEVSMFYVKGRAYCWFP